MIPSSVPSPFLAPCLDPSMSETWAFDPAGSMPAAQFEAVRSLVAGPGFVHMCSPNLTSETNRARRKGALTIVFRLGDGRLRAARIGTGGRVLYTVVSPSP